MHCRANELRSKDVVNIKNGTRIGYVSDFEIDVMSARVVSLVIYGPYRFFGLFGRGKDKIIRWSDIKIIGEDTILVSCDFPQERGRGRNRR